jgi:hypothetical protein
LKTLRILKGCNFLNTIPELNNNPTPTLYIALPVLNEAEFLPHLLPCLLSQDYPQFHVFICVNQPDEWWDIPEMRPVCEANAGMLRMLETFKGFSLTLIDRCTPGNGWKGKKHGVGWARKTLMDAIACVASDDDILVSLDADTTFRENYFSSLVKNFAENPRAVAVAVPYYHKLTDDESSNRAILRYEIYMRYYSLNLWRIGSPYTFTALGSAMAFPLRAFRAIGGMTPKMSGEDFYFLQKLRKYGKIVFSNPEKVYPAARFSDRVYFGTGPAMIKGSQGNWESYPIYSFHFFDEIRITTDQFGEFFSQTKSTPVTDFLSGLLKEDDPFQLLRANFIEPANFIRACHEKFDALRILQYLKFRQEGDPKTDEEHLMEFLSEFYPGETEKERSGEKEFSFTGSSIPELDRMRNFLVKKEEGYQLTSRLP